MTAEALYNDLDILKCNKTLLIHSLTSAVKLTFVEKFPEGFDRPCNENDFSITKKGRESQMTYIKLILESLADSSNHNVKKNIGYDSYADADNELLAVILVMCGENEKVQPWNTEIIVHNCQIILATTLTIFSFCDFSQLLSKNDKVNLVTNVLNILSPNLSASTWKYYPASVVCFQWFLFMIKQPNLGSHLQFVLPPSLVLVDDFINENKSIGVKCLTHIVQNITTTELQCYGHGDVIYNALLPLTRIREADLLFGLIPLILLIATKLEFNFRDQNQTKWSRFDSILEILLENMELEQLIELRMCYISHLGLLIDSLKHKIVRWSRRLLRIFEEYVYTAAKFNDLKSMNLCTEAIEKYTQYSKEVIPLYRAKLLDIILIAKIFTSNSSAEIQSADKDKLSRCVKNIVKSMSKASYEEFMATLNEKCENKHFLKFYEEFKNIIQDHN